jgi:hypothetical protein
MNERIKELVRQAWKEVLSETSIEGDTSNVYSPDEVVAFEQKFAELIVRECVGICECEWNGDADTFAASEAYNECADAIKEHFGVKE